MTSPEINHDNDYDWVHAAAENMLAVAEMCDNNEFPLEHMPPTQIHNLYLVASLLY